MNIPKELKGVISVDISFNSMLSLICKLDEAVSLYTSPEDVYKLFEFLISDDLDGIVKEVQFSMFIKAYKLVNSGPHVSKDLIEGLFKDKEVEKVVIEDDFVDLESETAQELVKTVDVDLLNELGIDSE